MNITDVQRWQSMFQEGKTNIHKGQPSMMLSRISTYIKSRRNGWKFWVRMGEHIMCGPVICTFSLFVIMPRIHSRHFQICWISEYWQIRKLKISSRHYPSIYARTSENVDEYSIFAYSRLFSENWRVCGSSFRWNCAMYAHSSQRWLQSHLYKHVTRDGCTLFTQSQDGNNCLCITTAQDVKSLHMLCSLTAHRRSKKLHGSGTQLPYSVQGGWKWLTRANNNWR